MNVTAAQKAILIQFLPNVEKLIQQGDVQTLLDAIDDVIVDNILAHNNEPDATGIMLQRVWDQIYNQN